MKHLFLLSFLLLFSLQSFSQKKKQKKTETTPFIHKKYLDEGGQLTTNQKEAYAVSSVWEEDCTKKGKFQKVRIEDGFVLKSGMFENGKPAGEWLEYHDNEKLKSKIIHTSEVNDDDTSKGKTYVSYKYYSNGQQHSEYKSDFGLVHGYLPDGSHVVKEGNGLMKLYDDDGERLIEEVPYVDGKRHGVSTKYYETGKVKKTTYENGKFKDDGIVTPTIGKNGVYDFVEISPEYPGGVNALRTKVAKEFTISKEFKNNPHGLTCATIIMRFTVEDSGKVSDISPLTNYGFGLEEEAKSAISKVKKFKPGMQDGKAVSVRYTLPIVVRIR